jgi:hypothetical protein
MDRAATRHESQARPAAPNGAADGPPFVIGKVAWHGDRRIVGELYELGCIDGSQGAAASARVVTVKSGQHRSVYRIELASGAVFLKHFKSLDWLDALRNTAIGTQAQREARAAEQIAAAGIETIRCVAVGKASRGALAGDCYLASQAIENSIPLDELARGPAYARIRTAAFRCELACSLGRLCGRVHRAGLVHRDLHPGNLLAKMNGGSLARLVLIDLQGVRPRQRWGTAFRRGARARWDLFGLYNFFQAASRADRCRFLKSYLHEAGALHAGSGWIRARTDAVRKSHEFRLALARRLEAFCRDARRREQLRYDKKWQRSNRRLIVADSRGGRCRALAILGADRVGVLRSNPELLFHSDNVRFWLRRGDSERAAVIDLNASEATLRCEAVERSRTLGWLDLFPRLRWTSLRRTWEMGNALRRRGIPSPRAILYLEKRSLSSVREILVTERSSHHVPLTTFLAHQFQSLSGRQKETWLKANARVLASALARMREFSLVHRVLAASDILVSVDPGETNLELAGTERIEKRRTLSRRAVGSALGQLDASLATFRDLRQTHRLRFLKKYLGDQYARDWKSIWQTIARNRSRAQPRPVAAAVVPRPVEQFAGRQAARAATLLLVVAAFFFCGCQAVERPLTLPVKYQVKCEQLMVLSDFKLQKDHELIRELSTLREQEARLLDLPLQHDPVVVYLFNNESDYRKYMAVTYPKLPPRSAYFVGSTTELAVYTHWGQSVREDLRHEYTHGLLHSALKRVPLWLDEGLAEYFEVAGPQPGGVNREYATKLSALLAQGWRPNMRRLEALGDDAQMRRADYQEAWAWVHFMLHGSPEAKNVLLSYLRDLRTISDPKPLSRRLALECPDFQERSMSYMARLAPERQLAEAL